MNLEGGGLTAGHRGFVAIGALLHLAVGLLVAVSTLVAPAWAVGVLWLVWIGAGLWAMRMWRRLAFAPLIAGGATIVFWVAFVTFGDLVLGWTA